MEADNPLIPRRGRGTDLAQEVPYQVSLFNPLAGQAGHLMEEFGRTRYIPLHRAAKAMGVPVSAVARNLLKMEKKGLLKEDHPYVEQDLQLVVKDHRWSNNARPFGHAELILTELEQALHRLPEYTGRFFPDKKKLGSFGYALKNLAEGFMSGKSASDNFRDSAKIFLNNEQPQKPHGIDFADTLNSLLIFTRELRTVAGGTTPLKLTAEDEEWLAGLRQSLQAWNNGAKTSLASGMLSQLNVRMEEVLTLKFLKEYRQVLHRIKTPPAPVTVSSDLAEVMNRLDETVTWLDDHDESIASYEIRAAVIQIYAMLREIRELYATSEDNYSRSDARSLRNTYLPMIRMLVEKYISFSGDFRIGQTDDPALTETVNVLKNDVPAALAHIRNDLKASRAVDLESDAEALRKKLKLDGLL